MPRNNSTKILKKTNSIHVAMTTQTSVSNVNKQLSKMVEGHNLRSKVENASRQEEIHGKRKATGQIKFDKIDEPGKAAPKKKNLTITLKTRGVK